MNPIKSAAKTKFTEDKIATTAVTVNKINCFDQAFIDKHFTDEGKKAVEEYINQRTTTLQRQHERELVEARIDELENTFVSYDNALASSLVLKPEWEYGQVTERIAELSTELNNQEGDE